MYDVFDEPFNFVIGNTYTIELTTYSAAEGIVVTQTESYTARELQLATGGSFTGITNDNGLIICDNCAWSYEGDTVTSVEGTGAAIQIASVIPIVGELTLNNNYIVPITVKVTEA